MSLAGDVAYCELYTQIIEPKATMYAALAQSRIIADFWGEGKKSNRCVDATSPAGDVARKVAYGDADRCYC